MLSSKTVYVHKWLVIGTYAYRRNWLLTFVSQHQGNSQKAKFATWLSPDNNIEGLEAVDEEKCQQNHILRHLCCVDHTVHPGPESLGGKAIGGQSGYPGVSGHLVNLIGL